MIPVQTIETLERYLLLGIPPGDGIKAVLEGSLFGAISRLDKENLAALKPLCILLLNDFPCAAIGSAKNVRSWISNEKNIRTQCAPVAQHACMRMQRQAAQVTVEASA